MRFKDFLNEKAMNMKSYSDTSSRLGDKAKVGFEFELIVTTDSHLHTAAVEDNRGTQRIVYFDSLDEFDEFFDITKRTAANIERDFDSWKDIQREEWVDNNWTDFEDEDTDEEEARKEAEDSNSLTVFMDRKADFGDWIEGEFGGANGFVATYDLEPKYGWYQEGGQYASVFTEEGEEDDDGIVATSNALADSLRKKFGYPIKVHDSYHGGSKLPSLWYIEPDSSINTEDGHGLELVSPPLVLKDALTTFKNISKWMSDNLIKTDSSTGLHINISIPDLANNIDPFKLVLFMGEKYVAGMWGRLENKYTKPQMDAIIANIKDRGIPDEKSLTSDVFSLISRDKMFTANFKHLQDGYIEFRVAGGEDYEKDIERIEKTILRFVTILEIACDPTLERKEYLKKAYALFGKVADSKQMAAETFGKFPEELNRLAKYDNRVVKFEGYYNDEDYQKGSFKGDKKLKLYNLIYTCIAAAKKYKTSLNPKERAFLKQRIKEVGLTSAFVDQLQSMQRDPEARKRFKQEIGI